MRVEWRGLEYMSGDPGRGRPAGYVTNRVEQHDLLKFLLVNTRGDPWCGRPARLGHAPPSHALCTQHNAAQVHAVPPHDDNMSGHVLHLPRVQKRAGGEFLPCFDAVRVSSTSLACKSELEVVFTVFRRGLCVLHLPRMPEVDLYGVLTPFVCPPPPSRTKVSRGGPLSCFNTVRAFSTSLACKSKPEVVFITFR
ncbi:hypothetical protein BDZ97DRAFT_975914 [Flammula alnicola]|nr:hypothetical protein BDZ97DRAFT_975914 [Flammula alnicola]